ncbi:MAG: MBL fold metallo-hydrolase [Rhodospirillales bacterium]
MYEIVPGVFVWSWLSQPHGYDFNGHLIRDAEGNICIDPVQPGEAVLDGLVALGVKRIVLTNRNHSRAAGLLRTRLGARVAIHADDAAHVRGQGIEIDDTLEIGEKVGPLTVVPAPGKSPGEIALHWPARRILIVGDAVIGNPPGACSVLPDKVMDDPARLRQSLYALLDLDFDTLLVGDGVSILAGAKERLRQLTARFAS